MRDQAATKQEQKCRHHWQCSQPIDGVVYQRCELCKDTLAVDAHAEGMVDLHPARVGGPQSPWWGVMNNRDKHEWYLKHRSRIREDVKEYGREGARKIWGISSDATLQALVTDIERVEPTKKAVESGGAFGHMTLEQLRMLPKRTKKALAAEASERGVNMVADEKKIPRQLLGSWCGAYSQKSERQGTQDTPDTENLSVERPIPSPAQSQPCDDSLHPAITGLLLELPKPGTPLTEGRKDGLRLYFSALVDLIYPEEAGSNGGVAMGEGGLLVDKKGDICRSKE